METKTKLCELGDTSRKTTLTSIDAIGDDLLRNILNRLPALHFASASCVNRSWHRLCDSVLSTPKLASALSLNPSIQDAVDEVFNKVFAEPIRPHFAIVAIGQSFEMDVALQLITKKLGSSIPIICTAAFGLMGMDVATNGFKEIPQWGEEEEDDHFDHGYLYDPSVYADPEFWNRPKTPRNPAVMLTVGFLPGMKVAAVTLSQTKKDALYLDEFVTDIRECSAIASGCTSPVAIMLFAGLGTYTDGLLEKLDCAMSPETAIVGDGSSVFICGGNCVQKNPKNSKYSVAAVALLFMRDRDRSHGNGNIQFHVALSTGMSPIGPMYKAASVREIRGKGTTWLTARREGSTEELDGQSILNQIYDEMPDRIKYPSLCIGVVKRRKCFLGSSEMKWITSQVFHEVHGGDEAQLFVEGRGIKTGDPFRMFQSDTHAATSSLENVCEKFRSLKQRSSGVGSSCFTPIPGNNIIFGGVIFACVGREDRFFGKYDVDSTPFLENFPGVPLAGLYCGNSELCRGDSSSYDQEYGSYRCFAHSYSSVYFVMSYTPSGPGI